MAGLKITLPLKDIQESLVSRITMLEELEAMASASIKKGGAVKTLKHNKDELKRIQTKMKQLQASHDALMKACCPNPMDCPHEIKEDA